MDTIFSSHKSYKKNKPNTDGHGKGSGVGGGYAVGTSPPTKIKKIRKKSRLVQLSRNCGNYRRRISRRRRRNSERGVPK
jgi:hypothetical protein